MKKIKDLTLPTPKGIVYKTVTRNYRSVYAPPGLGRDYSNEGEVHRFPDRFPSHVWTPEWSTCFARAWASDIYNSILRIKEGLPVNGSLDQEYFSRQLRELFWQYRMEDSVGSRVLVCRTPHTAEMEVPCYPFWDFYGGTVDLGKLVTWTKRRLVCWKLEVLGELDIDEERIKHSSASDNAWDCDVEFDDDIAPVLAQLSLADQQ